MALVCESCGDAVYSDMKYCPYCGDKLSTYEEPAICHDCSNQIEGLMQKVEKDGAK